MGASVPVVTGRPMTAQAYALGAANIKRRYICLTVSIFIALFVFVFTHIPVAPPRKGEAAAKDAPAVRYVMGQRAVAFAAGNALLQAISNASPANVRLKLG